MSTTITVGTRDKKQSYVLSDHIADLLAEALTNEAKRQGPTVTGEREVGKHSPENGILKLAEELKTNRD